MIPISLQPEPRTFHKRVRTPGQAFLANTPNPTEAQWKGKEFWREALPDMRTEYGGVCAYCACWIPHSTGSHSIDHFAPKSITPNLAYEWNNFRYVSTRFNSRKGVRSIVDPFSMTFYWFIIDFTTFFIKSNNSVLDPVQTIIADETIRVLKFNDDDQLVKERQTYYEDYITKEVSFEYLKRKAPFLAHEIERQNLK